MEFSVGPAQFSGPSTHKLFGLFYQTFLGTGAHSALRSPFIPMRLTTRRSIDDLCYVRLYGLEFAGITMGANAPSLPAAGWRCPRAKYRPASRIKSCRC